MAKVEIVIYRITGRQFFFNVPQKWCEECDLTIALTRSVLKELDLENSSQVRLVIKPWLAFALESLAVGGWHAPVLTINERVFSQGVVPDRARLKAVLSRLLKVPTAPANSAVNP